MFFEIKEKRIEVVIKRSVRSRRLRLSVHLGGEVVMSAPSSMSDARLEREATRFLSQKGEWVLRAIEKLKNHKAATPKRSMKEIQKEYEGNKGKARSLVIERLKHFNVFYGFKIGNISIRNQKSRWGSCSRKGNLNFNYRIALLPPHLSDYIIVHELCHIGQLNHSSKFWDLVAKTIPEHKKLRKELKGDFSLL
jgi:hypothetical protein